MVSVIIPTLNAASVISRLIAALRVQRAEIGEVLIVDSSSSDDTVQIAESMGAATMIVPRAEFDHGATRTYAGKAAYCDIVVYLTQDAIPADERSIEELVRPLLSDTWIGAVFGRQLPHRDANPFAAHLRLFNYPSKSYTRRLEDVREFGIKTAFLSNSFAAFRKSALDEIGWFREKMIMGEDMYAGAKMLLAGYKIAYVADAMVYHSHDYTIGQEFKRYFDIGVFHKTERWIRQEFGDIGGQGMKYVTSGLHFLVKKQKAHLIPEFAFRASMKYLGYKLGYHYEKLPKSIIPTLSMHSRWWYK
jgi:rhamnosyltransferase